MPRVLVAEDEENIRSVVALNLKNAQYDVTEVENGKKAVEIFEESLSKNPFDVVLLDVMMPVMDGLQACREIRQKSQTVGIIILSARSLDGDKISGLTMGADDYIVKGGSMAEVVARVDATYRRVEAIKFSSPKKVTKGFEINKKSRTISKDGIVLDLTQIEYGLMEYFLSNPGVALSRSQILKAVWGNVKDIDEKLVDVNIRRLRVKIEEDPANPIHLVTMRGFGYIWNE